MTLSWVKEAWWWWKTKKLDKQNDKIPGSSTSRDLSSQPFVDADDNDDSSCKEEDLDDIIKNSGNTFGVVHISDSDLVFFLADMEVEVAKII